MAQPVPSMNAVVDSITNAVESAIHRGNQAGGLRRYMLQGAIRCVLRDITDRCIRPRRSNGTHAGGSSGRHPKPRSSPCPSPQQSASGVCPTHVPVMFVGCARTPLGMPPLPSSIPAPPTMLLPPPPPLPLNTPARTWNGGSVFPATRRGAPSNSDAGVDAWLQGFAYDIDVVLPPPPPPERHSYANVTATHPRRNALPPGYTLGAGFASSSHEGQAIPHS
ncbi:hypothetical protein C2845_PM09G12600 [Panicum miliaceum]|uniref:Uncharacterized protein n=1 Tax=Panicum miliaceum TaxID=4540 RepID=A0A3L6S2A1_PANMI|nr:hypothetical protein C2845_PM09G12600 [Panicum miliaceum]